MGIRPIILMVGETVFGVIECFSGDHARADRELLQLASTIGFQIGDFIERQRAQRILADREQSYRVLTETASDGMECFASRTSILFRRRRVE